MTDLVASCAGERSRRRPPPGFGLLTGAVASLGLWAGLCWLAAAVF